ncbi:MAG TPA: maltose ABC transporter permease MalF [Chthoniobacterales bacterium]|nr:maltose ABC transporter permease MalF [Chthoniobacterales bacterium]
MSVEGGYPVRNILVALLLIAALYLDFNIYVAGNPWVALAFLIIICLGAYIYVAEKAYTYRYLFPGLLGFGLFVIFPIIYMVYLSFTKYSSQNLLYFDRSLALLRQETYPVGNASFSYKLYDQGDGKYILYLQDDRDPTKQFVSAPFPLKAGEQPKTTSEPEPLTALQPGVEVSGTPLEFAQVTRQKLFIPMRGRQFELPDETIVALEGLQKFTSRARLWALNPDGSLTNQKNGEVVHPDFRLGFFVNDKGDKVGAGFRTFAGFDNYIRIVTDPRIQEPFFKIFIWTIAFSALSVTTQFAVGMLLAVVLEWRELRFRRAYRTLLILPYAVPAVLSILIFKGLFSQEFGAVNQFLRAIFGFAPEWETNPWGARAMILLVNIWLGYPYMMLVCTGMLQSIPSAIYEASAIDGSGPIVNFFEITLPLVLPPLMPILIASFAFNFNNFNLIYLLTAGGPKMVGGGIAGDTDLLVNYTFNIAFRDSGTNYGLASAIATLLFIVVGVLAWINLKLSGRNVKI